MKIDIFNNKSDKERYNQLAVHPLQSWQWGEARQEMGIEVIRIGEYSNKQITNVYQLTLHPIPYTQFKIGYLPRSKFPSKDALNFLYEYGKKNNVIFIKIEPYEEKSKVKSQKSKDLEIGNWKLEIHKSPHPLFPSWTQIIDLTKSEDELLKNMHHKTRYNIRLAQKKSVVIKEMSNNEGFAIFSALYFETCKRQKYFGHNLEYHKIVWENLKKDMAHILIAFYKNLPLAAYELFFFKDTLYYPYGGTSLEFRNLMAANLLMWKAIQLGHKLGAKKFDLWGSLPPNFEETHPWAGFTRFKQGYGGKFVEFVGSYDLVIKLPQYQIYNLLSKLRSLFLKLRRLV